MPGPTGCPGSEPGSGTETLPWPSCCRTMNTAKTRDYSPAITHTVIQYVLAEWWPMVGNKSDLIDSDSTAHRTHASKVRCTAPAVVEGHISTGNDVRQRQT